MEKGGGFREKARVWALQRRDGAMLGRNGAFLPKIYGYGL